MSQPKKSHQCACFIHFIQLTIPRKVLCILIVNQHYWLKLIDPESVIKICQDFGEGACYTWIVEHKVQSLVMSELWLHTTIKSIRRKANISKLILIWNHKILWNKQHVRGIVSCLKSWGSGQLVHIQGRGGEDNLEFVGIHALFYVCQGRGRTLCDAWHIFCVRIIQRKVTSHPVKRRRARKIFFWMRQLRSLGN